MPRFFVPKENISKNKIRIDNLSQIHHIRDVLRINTGEEINIFDEDNNEFLCIVESIKADKIVVDIKRKQKAIFKKDIHITLACAIPKKGKFELIVQKSTELGVDRIVPLVSQNSIVRFKANEKEKKVERFRRVGIEAAKQCGRSDLPLISPPTKFKELLNSFSSFDYIFLPNLSSTDRISFTDAVRKIKLNSKVLLLIGPEGDFADEEVSQAIANGATPISLGKLVLRVETAAIVCAGLLSLFFSKD